MNKEIKELFDAQLENWPLALSNYKNLENIKTKQFNYD